MEDKKIVFDINAITNFVFTDSNDSENQSEITEIYSPDDNNNLTLVNRQLNEVKNQKNDSNTAIRYDLLKGMIGLILDIQDITSLTYGQMVALDTLYTQGFIKNI